MVDYFQVRRIVGFLQRTYPKPVTSHACLLYNICCVWKYHFYVSQEQVILNTAFVIWCDLRLCGRMVKCTWWTCIHVFLWIDSRVWWKVLNVCGENMEFLFLSFSLFFNFFFLFLVHKKYYFYKSIFILGELVIYVYNVL